MGSINVRKETGTLLFDFRYLGLRCREQTLLADNKGNRSKLQRLMNKIDEEIASGSFDYSKYFPASKMLEKIADKAKDAAYAVNKFQVESKGGSIKNVAQGRGSPLFKDFAEVWFSDYLPTWRVATAKSYRGYLDNQLIPHFGEKEVDRIEKADILSFRAEVAKREAGRLKPKTINKYVMCLKMVLNEAADRFNFTPPGLHIKPLKEEKVFIEPFSVDEVNAILGAVRLDWRDYLLVRFFTGMRTAEVDGLKWKYVDFAQRIILVRETFSNGSWEYTKNDGSQREIDMTSHVFNALYARAKQINPGREDLVFSTKEGTPIGCQNFLNRVWKPLLRLLKIRYRKPYQTRHTAATFWLAAGENPNWIAKQMGHANTNMLFTVYARYVPNLTHQDGSAMDRLLNQQVHIPNAPDFSQMPPQMSAMGQKVEHQKSRQAMLGKFSQSASKPEDEEAIDFSGIVEEAGDEQEIAPVRTADDFWKNLYTRTHQA